MILADGYEIKREHVIRDHKVYDTEGNVSRVWTEDRWAFSPGKFEGESPITEYLYLLDFPDDKTGSTDWDCYVQRFGKRLVYHDNYGFCSSERFASESLAVERFREIDEAYGAWLESDDSFED